MSALFAQYNPRLCTKVTQASQGDLLGFVSSCHEKEADHRDTTIFSPTTAAKNLNLPQTAWTLKTAIPYFEIKITVTPHQKLPNTANPYAPLTIVSRSKWTTCHLQKSNPSLDLVTQNSLSWQRHYKYHSTSSAVMGLLLLEWKGISVSLERHDTKIWTLSSRNQFDFG